MPASWLRVGVSSPGGDAAGLVVDALLGCGGSAVAEEGDRLVSYIAVEGEPATVASRVRDRLGATGLVEPGDLQIDEVPEQDWLALWRTGLEPRRIGGRIVVSPTWSDVEAGPHELVIRIDPQMAFGTGEHASTRGVLRLMQEVVAGGDRLLDVGSGSGILAIAAARLGAAHVLAVESDADALPNAAENLALNGVADRVDLLCEMVDEAFLQRHGAGAFDGILANVLSSVLLPLLPAFHATLQPGGWTILSGILHEEAPAMRAAAVEAGFVIDAEDAEEQWWSVRLRRAAR